MPVLIILAVLWGVVLIPPLLRSRSQRSADSIVDFNYKLDVLGRTNGNRRSLRRRAPQPPESLHAPLSGRRAVAGPVFASGAAQRSAKRRRDIFRGLALAVSCTFLLAISVHSSLAWALQIFVDVVAVAYVALWAWARSVQAERADKVRYMPELRVPELALRRSASS